MPSSAVKLSRFAAYAWGVLAFNLLVIVWGAYVRATGSGAGCGDHWPLCNGAVVPRAPEAKTVVEFTHRLTSGLALLLVVGLVVWAFRAYPRRHAVRKGAMLFSNDGPWTTFAAASGPRRVQNSSQNRSSGQSSMPSSREHWI